MRYGREATYIRDTAGATVRGFMETFGAFIAGGAVTSAFSDGRINDFDLFFPSGDKLDAAVASLDQNEKTKGLVKLVTDYAISFVVDGHRVQLIRVLTGTPQQIIDSFDFTICQGAFDGERFILGADFLQHIAQRRLVFNIAAEYPICSLYRARKFITRGYRLSGIDAIKLGLRIHSIKIDTYADLRKQLMGIDTPPTLQGTHSGRISSLFLTLERVRQVFQEEGWLERLDALTGESPASE
jgi:hypothetical protein